jgi:hypothetical protein
VVDVFISYSRANQDKVRILAKRVTALGYNIWWDDALPPHKSYSEVITEKIGEAKAAIVVWSESASKSEWVRAEADVARNQKKLIQTSFEDDILPPMPFNQIQVASLADWDGESDHHGWQKVQASLLDLCGPPAKNTAEDKRPVGGIPDEPPPGAERAPIVRPDTIPQTPVPPQPDYPLIEDDNGNSMAVKAIIAVAILIAIVMAIIFWPRGDDVDDIIIDDLSGEEQDLARFARDAVINDRDGWTNVRSGPSTSDAVITRVVDGEIFKTYEQSGNWWEVKLLDGRTGYMNRNLITLLDDQSEAGGEVEGTEQQEIRDPVLDGLRFASPRVIIPDSNSRTITNMEINDLDALELRLARNEIFARKGYIFKNQQLRNWFEQFDWYAPTRENVTLNDVELGNVDRLKIAEENVAE